MVKLPEEKATDSEVWLPIPGYEGIYEASNFGRIRTSEGKTTFNRRYPNGRVWKQRILTPKMSVRHGNYDTGKTDARVSLYKNGQEKTHLVARLIALTFIGEPVSDDMTVNHIDGNPMNNAVSNLEWLSRADNLREGIKAGLFANCHYTILVDEDGNRYEYPSWSSASKAIGRNEHYIKNCIRRGSVIRNPEGIIFKLLEESRNERL